MGGSAKDDIRRKHNNKEYDSDQSPVRVKSKKHKETKSDSDNSPPRKGSRTSNLKSQDDSDNSPPRTKIKKEYSDSDNSPPRTTNPNKKTLDGKKAGLQTASSLKSEMTELREKEKKRLASLSSKISGK